MEQIRQSTLDFLSDLRNHNEREWFAKNRKRYDDAMENFESFVQALIENIAVFEPILKGLEAKTCIFRINRDIRFTIDKTIYKTHLGAFIVRGGKKNGDKFAGYYFHVEPGNNSMIVGGAWIPPMPWLTSIREKISENGEEFRKIISGREFVSNFGEIEGEKLKTAPKGFPKDHKDIELLKLKSFVASRALTDREVTGVKCFEVVMGSIKALKPLNDFLNS
jgi:uncharacterized protein (TIGR02453 family)